MQRTLAWIVALLVAGCSSGPGDEPVLTGAGRLDEPVDVLGPNATRPAPDRFYLRDPDVLGLHAPGLRILNFTNNATVRLSNALLTGTGNALHWILAVPTAALSNRTASCAAGEASWRIKHFPSGVDTLTHQPLAAGNWSVIVHAERLSNLTLMFNTTSLASYRTHNGTLLGWRSQVVDADPDVESDNSPYRVTFNKTFQTTGRAWVVAHFGVRGDAFAQFREVRSKVEASDGFLCAEHRNDVPQAATGGALWNSLVLARLDGPGPYSYAGRFEATTAINALPSARADVLLVI